MTFRKIMYSKNLLRFLLSVPDASGTYFGMMLKKHLDSLLHVFESDYNQRDYYQNAAKRRLLEYIQKNHLSISPSQALANIQQRLQDCDLTINFPLNLLSEERFMQSDEHLNAFMLKEDRHSQEYLQMRGDAEKHYFNFSESELPSTPESQRARPHYAALNYANNPSGSAPGYGGAFFKLKPNVKYRTTYSCDDSYTVYDYYMAFLNTGKIPDINPKNLISSYFNLTHLISTLTDRQLDYLMGSKKNEFENSDVFYIEAHVHSNLDWRKDVDALVLVEDGDMKDPLNSYEEAEQEKIKENAKDFARKHNIDCYITDSKGNVTSWLHKKEENKYEIEPQKVKTQVWGFETWDSESFRLFKFRSNEIKRIGSLIKTYESIADKDNLTARLFVINEIQVAVVDWLENKPQGSRASTLLLLLDQVLKEQKELTESIADILEAESNPILRAQ